MESGTALSNGRALERQAMMSDALSLAEWHSRLADLCSERSQEAWLCVARGAVESYEEWLGTALEFDLDKEPMEAGFCLCFESDPLPGGLGFRGILGANVVGRLQDGHSRLVVSASLFYRVRGERVHVGTDTDYLYSEYVPTTEGGGRWDHLWTKDHYGEFEGL